MIPITPSMKVWKLWCSGMAAMSVQAVLGYMFLYIPEDEWDFKTIILVTLVVSPIIIGWVNRSFWRKYK